MLCAWKFQSCLKTIFVLADTFSLEGFNLSISLELEYSLVWFRARSGKRIAKQLGLRVRPPGIEWKTGRYPKMGKNWPKNRKWPSAPEMGKKWPKNGEKIEKWPQIPFFAPNPIFCLFLGHFSPISGRGPFSIFWPIFFPFLDFGPFSILYQAAWLAKLGAEKREQTFCLHKLFEHRQGSGTSGTSQNSRDNPKA